MTRCCWSGGRTKTNRICDGCRRLRLNQRSTARRSSCKRQRARPRRRPCPAQRVSSSRATCTRHRSLRQRAASLAPWSTSSWTPRRAGPPLRRRRHWPNGSGGRWRGCECPTAWEQRGLTSNWRSGMGEVTRVSRDWLGGLPRPPASAAPSSATPGGVGGAKPLPEPSILQRFDALLGALAKPPSTPPASASELSPSLADVFAPGSDRAFEFLPALRPTAGAPYRALANATVTPPNPVEVYALRLTSPLFGHAAPLRLLADGRRGEWPILEYDSNNKPIYNEHPGVVDLEGAHPEVLPGSWLVVCTRGTTLTPGGGTI